ncbi:MAG TPA: hypothetical protein VG273_05445 [Bryobacteraceae bacterium]|nr:hypothetical protein [Bryobacteraceae bacterium]
MRTNLILAGLLTIGGTAFGADPKLLNLVMPDVKVLAGANVVNAKISPLGQYVVNTVQGSGVQFKALIAATGFDPFSDVTEIVAATAADPAKPGGLVMMDGTFKVDQIVAALQGQKVPATVQPYAGATLITLTDPKAKVTPAVAFVGTSIAVAGDLAAVEAALDRSSAANSLDPALAARVASLSGNDDAWIVGNASISALLAGRTATPGGAANMASQMLQNIQSYSVALKLSDNVDTAIELQANTPENADALGNVFKLVANLGTMNATNDPQTAGLMQLLQKLQVTTSGTAVDLALSVPEATMEGLIKTISSSAKTPNGN